MPSWLKQMGVQQAGPGDRHRLPGALTLDDNELMVDAAVDGLGIAYVPESFARRWLEHGRLEIVLGEWCPAIPGLALYYPGRRHVPSPLRAFIDVLKEVSGDALR